MIPGLRDVWGLGDATTSAQASELKQQFQTSLDKINESLRNTAISANATDHQALVQQRDQLYRDYQSAVDDSQHMEDVLGSAQQLEARAASVQQSAVIAKGRWESIEGNRLAIEEQLAGEGHDPAELDSLRDQLNQANAAAKDRDFQLAFDRFQPAAKLAKNLSNTKDPQHNEEPYALAGPLSTAPAVPNAAGQLDHWQNPLIQVAPEQLFSEDRMDRVVNMHFAGEDGPEGVELNAAMEGLLFPQPGIDPQQHLATIGRIRGLSAEEVQSQFERFKQLQGVSQQMEATRGLEPDAAMANNGADFMQRHPDFLGRRSNLRFGQVVGEATGLDPAFAGMLNPTGGMVGPGMDNLAPTDADSPVVWHGIFHDAGGYLLNYQNSGPGYTYLPHLQPESGERGEHCFQGQLDGVGYWYGKKNPDKSILDDILVYDEYVKGNVEAFKRKTSDLSQESLDKVHAVADKAYASTQAAADTMKGTTSAVANRIDGAIDTADSAADALADKAREWGVDDSTVDEAQQAIDERLAAVRNQVHQWEANLNAKVDAAAAAVGQTISSLTNWADQQITGIQAETAAAADAVEQSIYQFGSELPRDEATMNDLRRGVNWIFETKRDAEQLGQSIEGAIERAQASAAELYSEAKTKLAQAGKAAQQELEAVKRSLTEKLDLVRTTTEKGIDLVTQQAAQGMGKLVESQQSVRDASAGVSDSLADTVPSGIDAYANSTDMATPWAGEQLNTLTSLFS